MPFSHGRRPSGLHLAEVKLLGLHEEVEGDTQVNKNSPLMTVIPKT